MDLVDQYKESDGISTPRAIPMDSYSFLENDESKDIR
jgi:hypothetical protein